MIASDIPGMIIIIGRLNGLTPNIYQ